MLNIKCQLEYRPALTRTARRFLPPLLALAFSRLVFVYSALSMGLEPFDARLWLRWDSFHYLSIARSGYFLPLTDDPGNAHWFPGYSWLLSACLFAFGGDQVRLSVIMSAGIAFAMLFLLWNFVIGPRMQANRLSLLFAASVFPGCVYYHAVFPIALLLTLALLTIFAARRGRWLWASVGGFCSAVTYPMGVIPPALAAFFTVLSRKHETLRRRLCKGAFVLFMGIFGLGVVVAVQWFETGYADAFFRADRLFHLRFAVPFAGFDRRIVEPLSKLAIILDRDLVALRAHNGSYVTLEREKQEPGMDSGMPTKCSVFRVVETETAGFSLKGCEGHIIARSSNDVPTVESTLASDRAEVFEVREPKNGKFVFQASSKEYLCADEIPGSSIRFCDEPSEFQLYTFFARVISAVSPLVALQTLVVIVYVVASLLTMLMQRQVRRDLPFLLLGSAFLVFQWCFDGHTSDYRWSALALPVVASNRDSWWGCNFLFLLIFTALAFPMGILFFSAVIL